MAVEGGRQERYGTKADDDDDDGDNNEEKMEIKN